MREIFSSVELLDSISDISSSSSKAFNALVSFHLTCTCFAIDWRPLLDEVDATFWSWSWRWISCTLKIPKSSSQVRFFNSRAFIMAIFLRSHTFVILSSTFRFIWAFKKLSPRASSPLKRIYFLPNISSTISPPFMWTIHILFWEWEFSLVGHPYCLYSWSLRSLRSHWLISTCNFFILIFWKSKDESAPCFVVQLHPFELFFIPFFFNNIDNNIFFGDNFTHLIVYAIHIHLYLILPIWKVFSKKG